MNRTTDPLLRDSTATFDALNRRRTATDAKLGVVTLTYTPRDELASVKDARNLTTTYTRDALGNVTSIISPDTGTTVFTHDAAGNVLSKTDARGITTTYTWDAAGRIASEAFGDGTLQYQYDNTTTGGPYAKGRLTRIEDPTGSITFNYDSTGRVLVRSQTVGSGASAKTFITSHTYSQGRLATRTLPSGAVVSYGYNVASRVSAVSINNVVLASSITYQPFGPVTKWTWGNAQPYERGFDLNGRVVSTTLGPSTATYSELGQVFGYDELNRLVSAQIAAGQNQGFTYDANSNRTSSTINSAATTYHYPATSHRLSSLSGATTRSFTYDNAGNTTLTEGVTHVYDGRGRLKQAGGATYLVNGLGQRVKKTVAGVETHFAYDEAGHLLGEYDAAGAQIQETVWLGDLPIGVIKPTAPSGISIFYVWPDHLGTPRTVSDSSNVSRWEWPHHDPFGNHAPNENPAGAGIFSYNLRFPGQYFDAETGKHYNYFRDYDASTGRYLQSDPIGLHGGWNTYGYVEGSPLGGIDPLGLVKPSPQAALEAAVARGDVNAIKMLVEAGEISPHAAQSAIRGIELLGRTTKDPVRLADQLGVRVKDVKDAIHACKPKNLSRGGKRDNPDVRIDPKTGEVYPEINGGRGGLGESIGNIRDFLP